MGPRVFNFKRVNLKIKDCDFSNVQDNTATCIYFYGELLNNHIQKCPIS